MLIVECFYTSNQQRPLCLLCLFVDRRNFFTTRFVIFSCTEIYLDVLINLHFQRKSSILLVKWLPSLKSGRCKYRKYSDVHLNLHLKSSILPMTHHHSIKSCRCNYKNIQMRNYKNDYRKYYLLVFYYLNLKFEENQFV